MINDQYTFIMYVFVELVANSHKAIILRQNLKKKSWSTWNFSVLVGDLIRYNMLYFKTWLSDQSIFLYLFYILRITIFIIFLNNNEGYIC